MHAPYDEANVDAVESELAALDVATGTVSMPTGTDACRLLLIYALRNGGTVVAAHGPDHPIRFCIHEAGYSGVSAFVDEHTTDAVLGRCTTETRLVFVETPSIAEGFDVDIPALSRYCQERGITLAIDNTALTPANQKPIELGADISLCSSIDSINGHDQVAGAFISVADSVDIDWLQSKRQRAISPHAAWHIRSSLSSLGPRMHMHSKNCERVFSKLLECDPELVLRSATGSANALSNEVVGNAGLLWITFVDEEKAKRFVDSLSVFRWGAETSALGGSYAYIHRDCDNSHSPMTLTHRVRSTVRLSCGPTQAEPLLDDVASAIVAIS